MKVVQIIPQERTPPRIAEQFFDVPVPQAPEGILEVFMVILQERVFVRIVVLIVDVPVLQVLEEIVGVVRLFLSASNNAPLRNRGYSGFSGRGGDP